MDKVGDCPKCNGTIYEITALKRRCDNRDCPNHGNLVVLHTLIHNNTHSHYMVRYDEDKHGPVEYVDCLAAKLIGPGMDIINLDNGYHKPDSVIATTYKTLLTREKLEKFLDE